VRIVKGGIIYPFTGKRISNCAIGAGNRHITIMRSHTATVGRTHAVSAMRKRNDVAWRGKAG